MELIGAIIAAVGAITAAIIQTYKVNSIKRKSENKLLENDDKVIERKVHVFDSEGGAYNQEFYDYFIDKIKTAKRSIYITGDGFDFSTPKGKLIAENYTNAFYYALKSNTELKVVRVQTKVETHPDWAKMLSTMLDEFGDRFEFFVLPKGKTSQISSVCAIDPEDKENSISEIMLSTETLRGTASSEIAGTAMFIEGKEHLAKNLQNRILKLAAASIKLTSSKQLKETLIGDHYYFAYGSNMELEQMQERSPSAIKIDIGSLDNHTLVFNRKGSYRPGGVASIENLENNRVYGVIWKINCEDLLKLDDTEDPEAYHRKSFLINTLDGKTYTCNVYVAFPQGKFKPDQQYLNKIINAAISADLPSEYIDVLRGFQE